MAFAALLVGFAGAKVREKFGLAKLFPYFFKKNFNLQAFRELRESQQQELLQQELLQHPWSD